MQKEKKPPKRILIDVSLGTHIQIKQAAAARNITMKCLVTRLIKNFLNKERDLLEGTR